MICGNSLPWSLLTNNGDDTVESNRWIFIVVAIACLVFSESADVSARSIFYTIAAISTVIYFISKFNSAKRETQNYQREVNKRKSNGMELAEKVYSIAQEQGGFKCMIFNLRYDPKKVTLIAKNARHGRVDYSFAELGYKLDDSYTRCVEFVEAIKEYAIEHGMLYDIKTYSVSSPSSVYDDVSRALGRSSGGDYGCELIDSISVFTREYAGNSKQEPTYKTL